MIINHDIHIHTHLSRCGKPDATIENYIKHVPQYGITTLGFTDHLWDDTFDGWEKIYEGNRLDVPFYKGQNVDHVLQSRETLSSLDPGEIKVYIGAEVEYDFQRHDLAITEENAKKFDYLIFPNSHTHMVMPKEYYADKRKHIEFMKTAFMDIMKSPLCKYIVTMAHPFCAVCCPYGYEEMLGMISDEEYKECYGACAENHISVEINLSKFRNYTVNDILKSNNIRQFKIAKACGCKFTFGSDAHTMRHMDNFKDYYVVAGAIGLSEDDILPVRDLLG